jgi:hypothetical protein
MFDTATASNGVKLALLEGQLLTREIDRATFIERAANLDLSAPSIGDATEEKSDQALAKPASDMGVATLEKLLLPPSRTKSTSRWQPLSSMAMPACNGWTARCLI